MALTQPLLDGGAATRARCRCSSESGSPRSRPGRWRQHWPLALTAAAALAALGGLLNVLVATHGVRGSPILHDALPGGRGGSASRGERQGLPAPAARGGAGGGELPARLPAWPALPKGPGALVHPFADRQGMFSTPDVDASPRCKRTGICDNPAPPHLRGCGPDGLGCVTSTAERKEHVRRAIAWSWEGYRRFAWGQDEVDVVTKAPRRWFDLGLTIVDGLDTLLLAGLADEYQQARHWVANHLELREGSRVQFFEVNIRVLGGLLSAYYLSGGDEVFLKKAEMLADRLMVAFNTSSGLPATHVNLLGAAGRAASRAAADEATNAAEAGTLSLEFTAAGRLLSRGDLGDAGRSVWYLLLGARRFSGLLCMGLRAGRGECDTPRLTLGSAADSTYEYMLKQWLLSGGRDQLPLSMYREAMRGMRRHLARHVIDGGAAPLSFVSEAAVDLATGAVAATSDRFEHLTCFVGGMLVLGHLHNITTNRPMPSAAAAAAAAAGGEEEDEGGEEEEEGGGMDDLELGARIGRACYELYHQSPSGLAPDSVRYHDAATGKDLPHARTHGKEGGGGGRGRALSSSGGGGGGGGGWLSGRWHRISRASRQLLGRLGPGSQPLEAATVGDPPQPPLAAGTTAANPPLAAERHQPQHPQQQQQQQQQQEQQQQASSPAPPPPPSAPSTPPPPPPPEALPLPAAAWSQLSRANFLRPEAVETLFYLWRATGDQVYREWGWSMFRAFEQCRLPTGGYATVEDVNQVPPKLADKMESFWLAETLKYFYLLFEDDANVLPLDQWVFNTEAHPLPVWGSPRDTAALLHSRWRRRAAEQERRRAVERAAEEAAARADLMHVAKSAVLSAAAAGAKPQQH